MRSDSSRRTLSPILAAELRRSGPAPSAEQQVALCAAAQAGGGAALNECIRRNLGMVVLIARRYLDAPAAREFTLDDLVAYGAMGLRRAIELFNPAKDCTLSTYATHWIRHSIRRAMSNYGRPIRVAVRTEALYVEIVRARVEMERQGYDGAPADFVAEWLGGEWTGASVERVEAAMRLGLVDLSPRDPRVVRDPVGAAACGCPSPEEALGRAEDRARLAGLLGALPEGQREAVRLRYRVGEDVAGKGGGALPYGQVGAALGLSEEAARLACGRGIAALAEEAGRQEARAGWRRASVRRRGAAAVSGDVECAV